MFRILQRQPENPPLTGDTALSILRRISFDHRIVIPASRGGSAWQWRSARFTPSGPTRAEIPTTARHAAEFWMIEPEIAFADLADNMELAEDMIKYVLSYVLEQCPQEMAFFNSFYDKGLIERLDGIISSDFGHITYTEAIEILEKAKDQFQYPVYWGCDLQTEHERYLTEQVMKRPVFRNGLSQGDQRRFTCA